MISRRMASAVLGSALLFTAACDDEVVSPSPRPAQLVLLSASTVTTAPGLPVSSPIRMKLTSSNGTPIANHVVHFAVTGSGNGARVSVDSAFTDNNGDVEVGVIAGAPGSFTVTATAEGVAPLNVTVNAAAPVADAIFIYSGNLQGGFAGEPIAPFTAVVLNELGLPQSGVTVNFSVASGGGSVSPVTAVTDANGRASTVLTLGTAPVQTVTATAVGLTASASTNLSATFTANVADPCTVARAMSFPGTINRALDALDCLNAQNRRIEYHAFTLTGSGTRAALITMTSTAFTPSLTLGKAGGTDTLAVEPRISGTASFRVFGPAGTYWLGASSTTPATMGSFTVTTAAATVTNENCPATPIYVIPGTIINGTIAATDCVFTGDPTQKADQYYVYLRKGQSLRVRLQAVPLASSSIDLWARITNLTTNVAQDIDCCGGATIEDGTHTATDSGVYMVEAGVYIDSRNITTGAYTIDILNP